MMDEVEIDIRNQVRETERILVYRASRENEFRAMIENLTALIEEVFG